ncbi:response regulator [Aestuariimicrobium soli]|uniref:response regulator n=1 Tax=Aestuariimicrobium soli TaxID=2035834 RepID=UPI003EC08B6A
MTLIRVLLVDDDPLVCAGLRLLLSSAPDLQVVGEVHDGDEVVAATAAHRPHVVLMDLRMARVNGVEATRAVRALPDPPQVIALTTWDVDDALVRTLAAGASGYLLKSAEPMAIIEAVRTVVRGEAVLSPKSTRQLLDHLDQGDPSAARHEAARAMNSLTEREREVVIRMAEGLTNAAIGASLYLSEATVKTHLSAAQTKLGVRNRVELAVLAERAGLLPVS